MKQRIFSSSSFYKGGSSKVKNNLGQWIIKMEKKDKMFFKKHPKLKPYASFLGGSIFSLLFIFLVFVLPQLIELAIFGQIEQYNGR